MPFDEALPIMKGLILIFLWVLGVGCQRSCDGGASQEIKAMGQTMGTFYSVTVVQNYNTQRISRDRLKSLIDERLLEINDVFSTYRHDSTISRFNRSNQQFFIAKDEFSHVINRAQEISSITRGAFSIFVDPLIDLWGFDRGGRRDQRPLDSAVRSTLATVRSFAIAQDGNVINKIDPRTSINLSGIAKGFGVDQVAMLIERLGYQNFMVEIGGDIVARGHNIRGKPWVIGIGHPHFVGIRNKLLARLSLMDKAIASSGTYINFFSDEGKTYSHIIDPRTGYPISTDLISVSIIAPDCISADAWATAAMILGEDEVRELLTRNSDLSAMFVKKTGNELGVSFAGNFQKYISDDTAR